MPECEGADGTWRWPVRSREHLLDADLRRLDRAYREGAAPSRRDPPVASAEVVPANVSGAQDRDTMANTMSR
jgi:hypothetical protein